MAIIDEKKQQPQEEEMTMSMPLRGRVAIVTGASRGIGKEIALNLAEKGAKVVVNYSSNQRAAEEVTSTINNNSSSSVNGVRAIACKADISDASQVAQLFDMAEQTFGYVHIIMNNAAVADPEYPTIAQTSEEYWDRTFHIMVNNAAVADSEYPTIAQTSEEYWDRIFNVNCKGAFLCSREAAKRVVRGGGGRIINISSSIVGILKPGYAAYSASKAAVEMMTRILAQELRGTQITANCVAPGAVPTDMFFPGRSEAEVEAHIKSSPFERLGRVEDVAPLVAFLASDQGEWVNAQVVRVNGGRI